MAPANEFLQQLGRTAHTSSSGIEITRTFYAKPYDSAPTVIKALQGKVEKNGNEWVRTPPARDTYIKNCYCNEAVWDYVHPDGPATSDDLSLAGGNVIDQLQNVSETTLPGAAGAKIVAHYRPLITAWQQGDLTDEQFDATQVWDWMDPKFMPGVRMLPWPDGLYITEKTLGKRHPHQIEDNLATPLAVAISDFTIRRILVGQIPWRPIIFCSGTVNEETFPKPGTAAANGLPAFDPRTLKFEGCEARNMVDSEGNRWYELVYHFKWIHHFGNVMFDMRGDRSPPDMVTWNHVLTHPSTFGFEGPTGWYEVWRAEQAGALNGEVVPIQLALLKGKAGRLYQETDFMNLFDLQAE